MQTGTNDHEVELSSLPADARPGKCPSPSHSPDRTARSLRLAMEYRPSSGLIPFAINARTHGDAQVAQIAASMRELVGRIPFWSTARTALLPGGYWRPGSSE
jgi:hypothetical protein